MGSDESHFNVSVGSDGQGHKTVSTNHHLFEEKGEPKRYRTEVLQLTSLTARPNRLTESTTLDPQLRDAQKACATAGLVHVIIAGVQPLCGLDGLDDNT